MKFDPGIVSQSLAEREMSRADLAERSGLTRSQVTIILKRGSATEKTVGKIAGALGLSAAQIIGGERKASV